MNTHRLFVGALFVGLIGCGQPVSQVKHTLPPSAPEKPSEPCRKADAEIGKILAGSAKSNWFVGSDNTCMVRIILKAHNNVLTLAQKVRDETDFYSYDVQDKVMIPLWWDEKAKKFPPVKDRNGHFISNLPTDNECGEAAKALQTQVPGGDYQVKKMAGKKSQTLRCYVEARYPDDASFEKFLAWNNPTTQGEELFHIRKSRKDGSTATIWIHVLRIVSDQN